MVAQVEMSPQDALAFQQYVASRHGLRVICHPGLSKFDMRKMTLIVGIRGWHLTASCAFLYSKPCAVPCKALLTIWELCDRGKALPAHRVVGCRDWVAFWRCFHRLSLTCGCTRCMSCSGQLFVIGRARVQHAAALRRRSLHSLHGRETQAKEKLQKQPSFERRSGS